MFNKTHHQNILPTSPVSRCIVLIIALFLFPPQWECSGWGFAQCGTNNYPGNLVISTNTVLGGTHNVTDTFRVDPGITLFVDPKSAGGCGYIEVNARVVQILGTIDGNGAGEVGGTGGNPGGCWAWDGSTDCRGIAFCIDKDNCRQLRTDGGSSGINGNGAGGGAAGNNGNNALGNKQQCNAFNDDSGRCGGAGGAGGGNGGCYGGSGGNSGSGGNGSTTNGCSGDASCTTTGGLGSSGGGASTTLCATYGAASTYTIEIGSGGAGAGGGGRGRTAASAGGNGGNGGGYVQLVASDNLFVTGAIYTNGTTGGTGGTGGNAGSNGSRCCTDLFSGCDEQTYTGAGGGGAGGGGGSGGGILLNAQCGSTVITGILQASGGNGGSGGSGGAANTGNGSAPAGGSGGQGGGGGGGRIKIFTNTCGVNNISPATSVTGGSGFSAGGAGTYFTGSNSIVLAGGSVATNQTICAGTAPAAFISVADATLGGCTNFIYQWQSSSSPTGPWTNIPGANSSAYSPTPLSSATYFRRIVTAGNCNDSTNVISIFVSSPPVVNAGNSVSVCQGSNTTLGGSPTASGGTGAYTYLWSPSSALNSNSIANPVASPSITTTYLVAVSDSLGCTDSAQVTVNVYPSLPVSIAGNTTICAGQSLTLIASGGISYVWNTGDTTNSISVSPSITTSYTVIATGSNGCTATSTATVPVLPVPVLSISGTQAICRGNSTTLTANSNGISYLWSTGSTTSSISVSPSTNTSYTVAVTGANGCSASSIVTVTVTPYPSPVISPVNPSICTGDTIMITAGGGASYLWSTNETTASIIVNPVTLSTYSVTVANGICTRDTFVTVNVNTLPAVPVIPNVTINYGSSATLSASGGINYSWSNGTTGAAIIVSPTSSATYSVIVTDANGCSEITTVTVFVELNCGSVFIPNAFSPNNDLKNDVLYVRSPCLKTMHFVIFDRWGEKVFEYSGPEMNSGQGWDGTYKGKLQNTGVYLYVLDYELVTGEKNMIKGNVSLLK